MTLLMSFLSDRCSHPLYERCAARSTPGVGSGTRCPPRRSPPQLTDDQLAELVDLIRDADSVELKLTVPESEQRSAVAALEMDPIDAQIRQVFFFDTPDLALNRAGVVVRGRRMQGKGDDSVVKLRPVVPAHLPARLRRMPEFGVEVDAMPGGFVCSGRMRQMLGPGGVRESSPAIARCASCSPSSSARSTRPTRRTASGSTTSWCSARSSCSSSSCRPASFGRKLVAEMWLYPDDSRILELSTKCAPGETFDTAAELRAYLSRRGVSASGEQETKTKRALEFFSSQLARDGKPAAARAR